jgi:hypothetical protein
MRFFVALWINFIPHRTPQNGIEEESLNLDNSLSNIMEKKNLKIIPHP